MSVTEFSTMGAMGNMSVTEFSAMGAMGNMSVTELTSLDLSHDRLDLSHEPQADKVPTQLSQATNSG